MRKIVVSNSFISVSIKIENNIIKMIELSNRLIKETLIEKNKKNEIVKNVEEIFRQFKLYLEGKKIEFSLNLDWSRLTAFQTKVFKELIKIPSGQTIAYNNLAERIGGKNYTRAVARALSSNPFPIVIPCHRVVASNGLGGFSADGGDELKLKLLHLESH